MNRQMDSLVIGRRALLVTMAGTAGRQASAALPIPPDNTLGFRLTRHGDEIGRHTSTFERNGEQLTVRVAVEKSDTLCRVRCREVAFHCPGKQVRIALMRPLAASGRVTFSSRISQMCRECS